MTRLFRASVIVAATLLLDGCILTVDDVTDPTGSFGCNDVAIGSMDTELSVGDSTRLIARKASTTGSACAGSDNEDIWWRSSNSAIASVHDNRWLVAVAPGWATLIAENADSGTERSVSVRVSW